jgi:hypothetical protein
MKAIKKVNAVHPKTGKRQVGVLYDNGVVKFSDGVVTTFRDPTIID